MAKFWFIMVFLSVCSCVFQPSIANNTEHVVKHSLDSVVLMQISSSGGWRTIGGGVIVRAKSPLSIISKPKTFVLSANHVLEALEQVEMRACAASQPDVCVELTSYVSGSDISPAYDWALSPVEDLPSVLKPARIRSKEMKLGESVVVIGYPWGQSFISNGIFSAKHKFMNHELPIVYGFAAPGNSGGPVFDSRGRLVGIVSAIGIRPDLFRMPSYINEVVYIVPITNVEWRVVTSPLVTKLLLPRGNQQ